MLSPYINGTLGQGSRVRYRPVCQATKDVPGGKFVQRSKTSGTTATEPGPSKLVSTAATTRDRCDFESVATALTTKIRDKALLWTRLSFSRG